MFLQNAKCILQNFDEIHWYIQQNLNEAAIWLKKKLTTETWKKKGKRF